MMKRCIIKATLAVAFIAVAGYTANNIQKEEVALSEIALQNVEALARGEGSGSASFMKPSIRGISARRRMFIAISPLPGSALQLWEQRSSFDF